MVAVALPGSVPVDEVLGAAGHRRRRRPPHAEAVRRPDPAGAVRLALVADPRPARARRAHRRPSTSRPGTAFWARCGRSPRGGKTVAVRHPLPRGGRRLRRPDRAHGRRPDRGRRADHRDQGAASARARSGPPCPASELAALRAAARRDRGRAPRRHASMLTAPTPTRPCGRCWPRYPDARDIEVRGAGLEEAFLELTGDRDDAEPVDAMEAHR